MLKRLKQKLLRQWTGKDLGGTIPSLPDNTTLPLPQDLLYEWCCIEKKCKQTRSHYNLGEGTKDFGKDSEPKGYR